MNSFMLGEGAKENSKYKEDTAVAQTRNKKDNKIVNINRDCTHLPLFFANTLSLSFPF